MEKQMAKYHVDRDTSYMYKMWGTTSLITDYWTKPHKTNNASELSDSEKNKMKKKIRNDAIMTKYELNQYGLKNYYR